MLQLFFVFVIFIVLLVLWAVRRMRFVRRTGVRNAVAKLRDSSRQQTGDKLESPADLDAAFKAAWSTRVSRRLNDDEKQKTFEQLRKGRFKQVEALLQAEFEHYRNKSDKASHKKAAVLARHLGAVALLYDPVKALFCYRQATELAPDDVQAWITLGSLLLRSGRKKEAESALEKIFEPQHMFSFKSGLKPSNIKALFGWRSGRFVAARAYADLALLALDGGDLALAAEKLRMAASVFMNKPGREAELARCYHCLGVVYRYAGSYEVAEEMHKSALDIYKDELEWPDMEADSYGNLGMVAAVREDYSGAVMWHTKSLEINEKLGRTNAVADQHINLGLVHHMRTSLDMAEKSFRCACDIFAQKGNRKGLARAYDHLAAACLQNKNYKEAERVLLLAMEINREQNNKSELADCLASLGRVHQLTDNTAKAKPCFIEAIALEKELNRHHGLANACSNLGLIELENNNLNEAKKLFKQALDLEHRHKRTVGLAADYGNLGMVEKALENMGKACVYWYRASKYFDEAGQKDNAQMMRNLVVAATEDGASVDEEIKKAVALQQKPAVGLHENITEPNQL